MTNKHLQQPCIFESTFVFLKNYFLFIVDIWALALQAGLLGIKKYENFRNDFQERFLILKNMPVPYPLIIHKLIIYKSYQGVEDAYI